jgi:hypothetical protein
MCCVSTGMTPSTSQVVKDILAKDGPSGFYRGLSAGLFRQATYTTARMGLFGIITDKLDQTLKPGASSLASRLLGPKRVRR